MDIFLFGLDPNLSEKRLKNYLRPRLNEFGIPDLELEKISRGKCALLTVLDLASGQRFIKHYNQPQYSLFLNKRFSCKAARDPPDEFKIRILHTKLSDMLKQKSQKSHSDHGDKKPPTQQRVFWGRFLSCGAWGYEGDELVFVSHYIEDGVFQIRFGKRMMVIIMHEKHVHGRTQRIDIPYRSIQSTVYKNLHDTIITFTLYRAPKVYLVPAPHEMGVELDDATIGVRDRLDRSARNIRVPGISPHHATISGQCFVYQLTLVPGEVKDLRAYLADNQATPNAISWPFRQIPTPSTYTAGMQHLDRLFSHRAFLHLDFSVKFQVQRLAQNGFLQPSTAAALLPAVSQLAERHGRDVATQAMQRLFRDIPYAGPESEAEYFSIAYLEDSLRRHEQAVLKEGSFTFAIAKRYPHLVLVHRVRITPTGMYLEGPELEPKNHVLRAYAHRAFDSFLRVSFEEEDGDGMRWDNSGTLEHIHYGRFKRILQGKIPVAGRAFSFLGFSHSSLRDQTCWFMAPFIQDGSLLTAPALIKKLGDFSAIRCPAKCAARIGQNFTDLNSFVDLPLDAVQHVPDVERNNRVFSDGCSAVSPAIIKRIWKNYELLSFKATVFQIRLGGAKGMVSLDPRLEGDVFQVRPSQQKFPADMTKLGICGVAKKALPFYLNRPMIKVLEDLGVQISAFQDLQKVAVRKLREIVESPINASAFLQRSDVGVAANLPWLFERLFYMGIDVFEDRFLWSIIELTVLINLRELKHRGRIPIEKGVTLYGIMDETDTLQEGEVYVSTTGKEPILGTIAVTRSPALHPGDIQLANAVSISEDCPLRHLFNCVVFSQRGQRDLPSMLSGGDLDGDQFNVFYEPLIMPKRTVVAADYPRVDPMNIDGPVETRHMTDFMINFMANDQLGRIANYHLALADMAPDGLFDERCLHLAELHSTAVDFSKTGVPADMTTCPRVRRIRPDFMAPGPRVTMEGGLTDFERTLSPTEADEEDLVEALNPESQEMKYYESKKALGVLYRAIDERSFLSELQETKKLHPNSNSDVLSRVWDFVQKKTQLVEFEHLRAWAEGVKEEYEATMIDLMCDYSPSPQHPLQEVEVFVGSILGKDGEAPTKRVRDSAGTVRDRYDELARFSIETILRGDDSSGGSLPGDEALERTIACLGVAVDAELTRAIEGLNVRGLGHAPRTAPRVAPKTELRSFGYLAAILSLRQVERFCLENGIPF